MAPSESPHLTVDKKIVSGRKTFKVRFNNWPLSPEKEPQHTVVDQIQLEQFEEEMQTTTDDDYDPQTWPVEKIVNKQLQNGRKMFEVKWEGYAETTWEPEENIPETLRKEFEEGVAPEMKSVEDILGQKMVNGRRFYKVKWSGWSETKWEPAENISEILANSDERQKNLDFPKTWSVQKIVNERMKNGRKMFEIKWLGWRKTTWEPRENIPEVLVQEFEEARHQTRESSKTWSVEKILGEKMENGHKMYQVKWIGVAACTWEPKENIPEIVIKKFEEKKLKSAKARKTWPVEKVMDEKMKKGRKLYQVKWVGWKNTTWEPKGNIPEILIKEYEEKKRKKLPKNYTSEYMWPVEKILDQKVKDGRTVFEVKWTGWPHTTWEPEKNIPETLVQYFKENRLGVVGVDDIKLETPPEFRKAETVNSCIDEEIAAKKRNYKLGFESNMSDSDESTSESNSSEDEDDSAVEPSMVGFKKNLTPDKIIGALNEAGKLFYLIKWKEVVEDNFVLAEEANKQCPQLVIQFLQSKIEWNFTR